MPILWILLGAALVVAGAIFHSLNPQAMDVNFFGYPIFGVPMWMLVAVPAAIGLALGLLMDIPVRVKGAWHERKLAGTVRDREKTIASLQQRVTELERNLAVAETPQPPVVIEEIREVPAGTLSTTRTSDLRRAA
jgi:hypothetical protein